MQANFFILSLGINRPMAKAMHHPKTPICFFNYVMEKCGGLEFNYIECYNGWEDLTANIQTFQNALERYLVWHRYISFFEKFLLKDFNVLLIQKLCESASTQKAHICRPDKLILLLYEIYISLSQKTICPI